MAANRKITLVASGAKNKTENVADYCREYITNVRTGFDYGNQSPYLFLLKINNLDRQTFKTLHLYYDDAEGSVVIITPDSFVTY